MLRCHPGCQTPTYDFRAATERILASARRGDALFFDPPYLKTAFVYYARQGPERDIGRQVCRSLWCSEPEDRAELAGAYTRAWLLIDDGDPNNAKYREIPESLDSRLQVMEETPFRSRLRVVEYGRPG